MKKVALTVAVLALGLAACAKNTTDNNAATDTNVENAAAVDTNAAVANDATANLDADDMRMLVKERSQIAQIQDAAPVAIVAPTDNFFDLFKIFNGLTTSIRPIAVFREVSAAELWLDQYNN